MVVFQWWYYSGEGCEGEDGDDAGGDHEKGSNHQYIHHVMMYIFINVCV